MKKSKSDGGIYFVIVPKVPFLSWGTNIIPPYQKHFFKSAINHLLMKKTHLPSALRLFLLSAACTFGSYSSHGQIITTIAGNGTTGFSGDGGAATSAQIYNPTGIALDGGGNLYIADFYNHKIRKVTPAGIISTVAGSSYGYSGDGGAATAAQMATPEGVAVDGDGNIYIADNGNNCIRKVDAAGTITTYAGNTTAGFSGDGGPATAAELAYPSGVTIDAAGNLYIADQNNNRVRIVTPGGTINTFAGTGTGTYGGDGGAATAAQLYRPTGTAVDAAGNVYIADEYNNRIRKVLPSGTITTIAGTGTGGFSGDGGPAVSAHLYDPWGVGVDAAGNIYIGDGGNQCVRKIDASGNISTIAGIGGTGGYSGDGGAATAAKLQDPGGVLVDAGGNIYIDDYYNNRIRYIAATNHTPYFDGGTIQADTVCKNSGANSINALLSITDADTAQAETWTIVTAPSHGTLSGFSYTGSSTGGSIMPSGLTYMPTAGYSGVDTFVINISDGTTSSNTTIGMMVNSNNPLPAITGTDSVCAGDTVALSNSVSGGTWYSTNSAVSVALTTGRVVGVATGTDTISYVVTGPCGNDTARVSFKVRSHAACTAGIAVIGTSAEVLNVYPNPGQGIFTLSMAYAENIEANVTILNVLGKKVMDAKLPTNHDNEIRLNVPDGIYMINVAVGNEHYTKKIVVAR